MRRGIAPSARPPRVVARPEPRRALLRAQLVAGAHDEQQEERVQEVLPAEPRRNADGRALGRRHDAGVGRDELLHGRQSAQPPGHEHDRHEHDERDDGRPQHEPALRLPPVGGTGGAAGLRGGHGHLRGRFLLRRRPVGTRRSGAGAPTTAVKCGCLDDSGGGREREVRPQQRATPCRDDAEHLPRRASCGQPARHPRGAVPCGRHPPGRYWRHAPRWSRQRRRLGRQVRRALGAPRRRSRRPNSTSSASRRGSSAGSPSASGPGTPRTTPTWRPATRTPRSPASSGSASPSRRTVRRSGPGRGCRDSSTSAPRRARARTPTRSSPSAAPPPPSHAGAPTRPCRSPSAPSSRRGWRATSISRCWRRWDSGDRSCGPAASRRASLAWTGSCSPSRRTRSAIGSRVPPTAR